MRTPRIYQAQTLAEGKTLILSAERAHYVNKVLRLTEAAPLIIFNGEGGEYHGNLVASKKNQVAIALNQFIDKSIESPLFIHLGQAISRGEKMDYTIQKAVELGVGAITPLFTERCGVKLPADRLAKRQAHWQGIIISACEQCGRNTLPTLHEPIALNNWYDNVNSKIRFVLNHRSTQRLSHLREQVQDMTILIGPEGGLTDQEIKVATEQAHFQEVVLGPRLLRTETAGIVVMSILQNLWGDF